jgi:hypothetical protein
MKTNHTITVTGSSLKFVHSDTKRIINWLGRYHRALETEDFIYFVNFQEGDENACVMMYRKSDLSLASDNYFAYNDMFELMTEREGEITYISKTMKYNLKLHKEAENSF